VDLLVRVGSGENWLREEAQTVIRIRSNGGDCNIPVQLPRASERKFGQAVSIALVLTIALVSTISITNHRSSPVAETARIGQECRCGNHAGSFEAMLGNSIIEVRLSFDDKSLYPTKPLESPDFIDQAVCGQSTAERLSGACPARGTEVRLEGKWDDRTSAGKRVFYAWKIDRQE